MLANETKSSCVRWDASCTGTLRTCVGDDIVTEDSTWLGVVQSHFAAFAASGLPHGFGCVALNDSKNPNFPSFPVVHKRHIEAFNGFCPEKFVNQDGDPWVYELYRSYGASVFARNVHIHNTIGGASVTIGCDANRSASPRYKRTAVPWKDKLQEDINDTLYSVLGAPTTIVIDVVVPTYRTNLPILERILNMDVPGDADVMFIIVVDNPETLHREELLKLADRAQNTRVRFNTCNVGASITRNRGIDESAAEWILFVDDDVEAPANLLSNYVACITARGAEAAGFVGVTTFPEAATVQQAGTQMSYISYFWDVADRMPICPWGVTANLVLRRTSVRFHTDFIRTGGGEDIAMCLDTVRHTQLPLLAAPAARALLVRCFVTLCPTLYVVVYINKPSRRSRGCHLLQPTPKQLCVLFVFGV